MNLKLFQKSDEIILLFIVLTGIILRFYDFSGIPMTHDELSALYRLKFDSVKELILQGVKEDGHPPGVQVFLFYWTKLFGTKDPIVKLPFLFMGIGSILLAYNISKKWFNSTCALLVATYLASLQYTVMYSQIARPYISGLFLCLLMVLFWTSLLFGSNRRRILVATGYIVSTILCCYNHHFSLLFAVIVGTTGLFFLKRDILLIYILSLIVIAALYLPNLNLTLYQLGNEGLSWLEEPGKSFVLDYFKYIFHFSPVVYASVFVLLLIGLYSDYKKIWPLSKFQIISIAWFLIPLIVGILYSKIIAPVIQYSVLIFSFPFFLFFIFSFFKPLKPIFKLVSVGAILIINISTLIWTRHHYEVFYAQPFKEYAIQTQEFLKHHDDSEVSIILQGNPIYIDHYFSLFNPGITYTSIFDTMITPSAFRNFLSAEKTEYLIAGGIPPDLIPVIKEYYPHLVLQDFGFTYETYIVSRDLVTTNESFDKYLIFSDSLDITGEKEHWNRSKCNATIKPDQQSYCALDSSQKFGPSFTADLSSVADSRYNILNVELDFKTIREEPGQIVCELSKDSSTIFWRSSQIREYYDPENSNEWQKAYLSFRLTNCFDSDKEMKDCKIKIYYWNNNADIIYIGKFSIQIFKGNDRIYSLIEPIEKN